MSLKSLTSGFAKPDPFPFRGEDPYVDAASKAGLGGLAEQLSYELGAAEGNSVTSHFNMAVSGDPKDEHRREVARGRIAEIKEKICEALGRDPAEDSDHDGGGAPPPPGAGR